MKTTELKGAALDWAVATALGCKTGVVKKPFKLDEGFFVFIKSDDGRELRVSYSTSWAHCGPLIDQYKLDLWHNHAKQHWVAWINNDTEAQDLLAEGTGETPLVAVCRAIVLWKCGETVKLPPALSDVL